MLAAVKALDLDPAEAEQALVVLARHVPADVELGRPFLAQPDDGAVLLATTLCWWWVDDGEALRLVPLSGGRAELTVYRHGEETSRTIGHVG